MASAVVDRWPPQEGPQALGPYGEGLGSPQGFGDALSGAGTLHTAALTRERIMWLLLELLSHQDLAAEMLFQEVGRARREEGGAQGSEPGKGAGLWALGVSRHRARL